MLTFHILRLNSNLDDKVAIDRIDPSTDLYRVTYVDMHSNIKSTFVCTSSAVIDYVENMLTLLRMDDDPFEAVQMSSPAYPTCYVKIPYLTHDKIEHFMHVLRNTFSRWPTTTRIRPLSPTSSP